MIKMFSKFETIEELYNCKNKNIPNEAGVYVVVKPKDMDLVFINNTTALNEYNGKNMLYSADILKAKYEKTDKIILYIGKAGGANNRLKQRIRQLVKYGYKEGSNHRGGRAMWQIENNKKLIVGYFVCDKPEKEKQELLLDYKIRYGEFPVANW